MSSNAASPPTCELYVDGKWRATDDYRDVIDPTTEQVVGRVAEARTRDAEDACAAARAAQQGWARLDPRQRAEYLSAVADELEKSSDSLIELPMTESGFPRPVAATHLKMATDWFRFAAHATTQDHAQPTLPAEVPAGPGRTELLNGVIQRRPVGVVACIVPFNGPLFGSAMKVAQALAMGNAAVVKPAPQNPLAVGEFFKILDRVGLPAGVANLITSADATVGAAISSSKDVDLISFTGSTTVAEQVYKAGAASMKRLLLELGGKGACLVCDDADLDAAANGIANVWRVNSGQSCSAPTRVIANRRVHDELVSRLVDIAKTINVGSPFDPETTMGPLVCESQRDRVEGFIESARREGAEVTVGGDRAGHDRGFFVAPTLLTSCTNDMHAVRNEIFGPVVSVIACDDDDQAVEIANDSDYGLYSYVFTGDRLRGLRLSERLIAGTVQVNTVRMKGDMPRGGVKMSGIGRECGLIGLYEYSEMCSVVWS